MLKNIFISIILFKINDELFEIKNISCSTDLSFAKLKIKNIID